MATHDTGLHYAHARDYSGNRTGIASDHGHDFMDHMARAHSVMANHARLTPAHLDRVQAHLDAAGKSLASWNRSGARDNGDWHNFKSGHGRLQATVNGLRAAAAPKRAAAPKKAAAPKRVAAPKKAAASHATQRGRKGGLYYIGPGGKKVYVGRKAK